MRRPDVGRHIDAGGAQFQKDFQKVMAVQAKNGPSVRVDVADGIKLTRNGFRFLKTGQEDQTVNLAHFIIFLINRTDFPGNYKMGLHRVCKIRIFDTILFF